jgi:hypothetical protein
MAARFPSIIALVLLLTIGSQSLQSAEPGRNTDVDRAIDRGLDFLQRTQDRDGAWWSRGSRNAAITGLCVMAFLSAGHVPGEGPYAETVEKGIRWVLNAQQPSGLIATERTVEMYHHGICTLMLAEVAGMTDERLGAEIRPKLAQAVAVILKAQRPAVPRTSHSGGWRYQVQSTDSDISITGWQLLALRAAKNLGCDVPAERIEWAVDYLKRCQDPVTGGFCYQPGTGAPNTSRTGTGVLGLEICGKQLHRSPECLKGARYLQDRPVGKDQYVSYAVYYGAQAMFQLGGNYWSAYRPRLHQALLPSQNANGAWPDRDNHGGPTYSTSMAVLALTVEYRYLPIYQRAEEPAEKD